MHKQKVTDKTHVVQEEESQETEDSSVLEEIDEFLDEVDQILEGQEVLGLFLQKGGQ